MYRHLRQQGCAKQWLCANQMSAAYHTAMLLSLHFVCRIANVYQQHDAHAPERAVCRDAHVHQQHCVRQISTV